MANALLMPSLSPTMEEGTIAEWKVKVGDKIEEGMVICTVETDKTTVEYESLDEGYLRELLPSPGDTVKVNQLIGMLTDEPDEEYADELEEAKKESEKLLASGGSSEESAPPAPSAPAPAAPAVPVAPAPIAPAPIAPAPVAPVAAEPSVDLSNIKASPVAKKMALAKGIPLAEIKGSGPNGRILKEDVEKYQPAVKAAPGKPAKPDPSKLPAKYGSLAPIQPTQDIPVNNVMKVVGKRLQESQMGAPHFYVTMKIYVDKLNALRAQLNATPGYRISVNDLVVKATAANLRAFPEVNASFHGDIIRQHSNIDISVAVALPDGLITPIVKNADQKGLGYISTEVKSLVKKAQTGTLAPEEFQGGTFTISNMGMFGVSEFTSIINAPHAGILAVAGTQTELYKDEDGEIKERSFMNVTMTSDHRVINGAVSAQFLKGLKEILENPVSLML